MRMSSIISQAQMLFHSLEGPNLSRAKSKFLQKYSTALKELPDYENYDTSRTVYDANTPDNVAVGAYSPGG